VPTLAPEHLTRVAVQILVRLGTPEDVAAAVARWLVDSDRSGHPSHGTMRVIDYAKRIRSGDLVPTGRPRVVRGANGGPLVLIDGCSGYGHLAANELVRSLVERAQTNPIVLGGIVNASHTGRLGEWAELAARHGTILYMCSSSLARGNVAAFGAGESRLGTNPMALGLPAAGGDYALLDFATSEISGGKIDHLIEAGEPAPPGTLLDRDGEPTSDPHAFHDGGMLLAFGGHKGYGLSLAISVLAGCVVGQAAPDNSRHGVFAFAVNPGAFADPERVLDATRVQLERMRSTRPRDGFDRVEVPGDFERRNRQALDGSLQIDDATWESILALGQSLELARDELQRGVAP
jgi:LDH2 family malate/lactate/ureidoglycolate dehydrogenase